MKVGIVYTPKEIHPDVVAWLTEGWESNDYDQALHFLKHLSALRRSVSLDADYIVVIEEGAILAPDFDKKVEAIANKMPFEYTTCLLTHYVTSWQGITYLEGSDYLLCHPTENVLGSFAYLIRKSHVEHLLGLYDRPLRQLPHRHVSPEKISRLGRLCMVVTPLVARLDRDHFKEYYGYYNFKE